MHKDNDLNVVRMALHHDSLTRDILAETDHPVVAVSKANDAVCSKGPAFNDEGDMSVVV